MDKDEELEKISDQIRRGEPVNILDAIRAIDYQENLKDWREQNSFWARFKRFLGFES